MPPADARGFATDPTFFTVADTAARLGLSEEIVLGHIRARRLRATNIGLGKLRPRWRISLEAIEQFVAARTVTANLAPPQGTRGKKVRVTNFF